MMTNNSVRISPKVRAIVYAVWIAAGLVVAAIATYAAAMGEPAPHWLGGASAVTTMIGTACGFTALAHVNSGATPDATTGQTVQGQPEVTLPEGSVKALAHNQADDSTDATSTDATSAALAGDSQTDSGDATAVADDAPAPHSPLSTAADAAAAQSTGSTPSAGTVPAAAPVATTAAPAAAPAAAAPVQPAVTPVASI